MNSDPGEVALQDAKIVDVGWVVLSYVAPLHFKKFSGKKYANGHIRQEKHPMSHEE